MPFWSPYWPRFTGRRAAARPARASGTERLTVYTSSQTHSSVEKACRVAGLGTDALRMIDIDLATGAARPDHLHQLVEADRAAGYTSALIVASIGTTGLGAIDPVAELGRIARSAGAWLHVDAAWAGVAGGVPELRWLNEGLEFADSYCTNPHKWLLTNFDCDAMWVAERDDIVAALSILPEYLRNAATESGQVIDYRDWHVPLGRRFRGSRSYGPSSGGMAPKGSARTYDADVALAQEFASWVAADDRFELVGPHPLALVTFRLRSGDEATQQLMERVNAAGRMYLTHTAAEGRPTLRMAIGSPQTEYRHGRRGVRPNCSHTAERD
jgi:aromatic-L-amino-acid decarboxylase